MASAAVPVVIKIALGSFPLPPNRGGQHGLILGVSLDYEPQLGLLHYILRTFIRSIIRVDDCGGELGGSGNCSGSDG